MTTETQKIPTGYKQTEIGVIPADWKIVKAGDIGRFRGGNGFPTRLQGANSGEYPFYKVSDMNNAGNDTFMFDSNNWISDGVKRQLNATIFPAGSIIFAKVGAAVFLERKKILTRPSCIDNNLAALVLDSARTDVRFIHYVLHSIKFGALVSTTALPSLSGSVLSQMSLPLPSLDEQVAITSALSDVDALISKLEALIQKKKLIKQGAMQELLTGKRRLPGLSGKWKMKRLGDLLDYEQPTKYLVKSADYSDNYSIPVLTAGKTFVLGYTAEETGLFQKLPTIIFDDFTTAIKYVDFPFKAKSSAMKMLVPRSKDVNLKFVFAKMQSIDFKLGDHKRYWISEYQNLDIETPTSDEQIAIASVLSDMDAEIQELESQLTKYQNLKQGMIQVLLTGKIRLI